MQEPDRSVRDVLIHSGVLRRADVDHCIRRGSLRVNGDAATPGTVLAQGDRIHVEESVFCVGEGGQGRLQLFRASPPPEQIHAPVRVHCGYHKCLTEYARSVYKRACRPPVLPGGSFRHYYHRLDAFYQDCHRHSVTSVSGQVPELDRFDDIRVVRFVRDPRDLLVSGYFYHKRGVEHWCHLSDPVDNDWMMVNGHVPAALSGGRDLYGFLHEAGVEEGLLAELEFRRYHFESMRDWPADDERIRLFRYEDLFGHEAEVFREILSFFGLPWPARLKGRYYARRYSASRRRGKTAHIRNPSSGQWRRYFTPEVSRRFNELYGDLLERYGYPQT